MPQVKDNPAASRFEMASGGAVAFVEYERAGDGRIALLHTEVPEALSGTEVAEIRGPPSTAFGLCPPMLQIRAFRQVRP